MKIRLENFSVAMLSAQSAFSVLSVRLSARMSSVRWPTGLVFARQFLLFVPFEIRIPGWGSRCYLFDSTMLAEAKFLSFFPLSLSLDLFSPTILSCLFLSGSRFVRTDGSTSGVPSIILRTKHEGNCRASWSFADSMAMFFRTALDPSSIFSSYRFLLI